MGGESERERGSVHVKREQRQNLSCNEFYYTNSLHAVQQTSSRVLVFHRRAGENGNSYVFRMGMSGLMHWSVHTSKLFPPSVVPSSYNLVR